MRQTNSSSCCFKVASSKCSNGCKQNQKVDKHGTKNWNPKLAYENCLLWAKHLSIWYCSLHVVFSNCLLQLSLQLSVLCIALFTFRMVINAREKKAYDLHQIANSFGIVHFFFLLAKTIIYCKINLCSYFGIMSILLKAVLLVKVYWKTIATNWFSWLTSLID